MELNNRELAALILLFAFFGWALRAPKVRRSLKAVLTTVWRSQIIVALFLMCLYVTLMVVALQRVAFWETSYLKETLIWTFAFALVALFEVPDIRQDVAHLKKVYSSVLSLAVVLVYVINLYTLPLVLEILLALAITVVGILLVFGEHSEDIGIRKHRLKSIQAVIGVGLLLFVLVNAIVNYHELVTVHTLKHLLLPVVLSILYAPFLYALALYAAYEFFFGQLQFLVRDDSVRSYLRKRTLALCHLKLSMLIDWAKFVMRSHFMDNKAVDAAIEEFHSHRHAS